MRLGENDANKKLNYSKIRNWWAGVVPKIKCFFMGHKYSYQMGNWKNGRYEDIYLTCDRCGKNFLKLTQTQLTSNLSNLDDI